MNLTIDRSFTLIQLSSESITYLLYKIYYKYLHKSKLSILNPFSIMKNMSIIQLNGFTVNKKELLGHGATGEVYAGTFLSIQAETILTNLQWP